MAVGAVVIDHAVPAGALDLEAPVTVPDAVGVAVVAVGIIHAGTIFPPHFQQDSRAVLYVEHLGQRYVIAVASRS